MARLPGPGPLRLAQLMGTAARRPQEAAWKLYQAYGPVVRLGYGPLRYIYLFGRDANELILSQRPDDFTWREALRSLEPVDGPTALVLSDGEEHRRRRRLVQPSFATRRIDGAVPIVVEEIDRTIDALQAGDVVDIYTLYRRTVRRIVVRVLFGEALAGQADALGDALEPAIRFVDRPPQLQVRGAPGSSAARRARRAADVIVDAEIARRRRAGQLGADVLGVLMDTELRDAELRDQVVSLVAAGYDTTSAAVAWTALELLRHPAAWDGVAAEVRARLGEGAMRPDAEDLRALPYVGASVNEALRLWPPAAISGRRATTGFTFAGHDIAAGSIVLFSPYVTHRLPELWGPDAETFRPDRWLEQEPPPFAFIPFGGAYRRCLGFALALVELQVAVIRLVQRTSLSLLEPAREVRGRGLSALRPDGGVPVRVDAVR